MNTWHSLTFLWPDWEMIFGIRLNSCHLSTKSFAWRAAWTLIWMICVPIICFSSCERYVSAIWASMLWHSLYFLQPQPIDQSLWSENDDDDPTMKRIISSLDMGKTLQLRTYKKEPQLMIAILSEFSIIHYVHPDLFCINQLWALNYLLLLVLSGICRH